MTSFHDSPVLVDFASTLLRHAGLDSEKANSVAETLVEADLLGHNTHGLALLPAYLADLEKGWMATSGEPERVADLPAAFTWDGRQLPGPWLVQRAIDAALPRARRQGVCTAVIRRSHHIACLQAYLKRVTDQGLVILLSCSDPLAKGVAPHGGCRQVYTPNPIAAGWPTRGNPVLMDVSMSIATNAMTRRLFVEKRRFPGSWVVDAKGRTSDDPSVVFADPPGALLPVGGDDHGHKGFALGLLVEALTSGLGGFGRADDVKGWTANVFLQILDPTLFGGVEAFTRETQHLADLCRASPPRPGVDHVRLPGEASLQRRAEQLAHGVELYPGIMEALKPLAERCGLSCPGARARE